LVKEESYFFRMSNYADRWLQFIEENPDFIQPASRRNEMIEFVKSGLEDLSVSRSSFDWGIPVPFDDKHVVYVWFDALVNYLTGIGYLDAPEKFEQYWPADLHLVGKEIVRFHAIIWPIMLMSLGLPLPKKVYGHGWLIVDGVKMSKSIGNVVDPMPLLDEFGADAIRYFLTTDISLGQDGNFSRERLIKKTNSDLANDLGNLLHRTLTMVEKYRDGVVTATDAPLGAVVADANAALTKLAQETVASYTRDMDKLAMNDAFKAVWVYVRALNKYIDTTEPWKLSKGTAPADLDSVLYHLVDGLRTVAILVTPLIPQAAENMWAQLGLTDFAAARLDGAAPETYPSGTTVHKTQPLFPRHELDTVTE
ncbi:MAG: methionine--tRNA ligase, partial [Negativicoccus succinicivorans]|nr:methionine--tRNA ligase [Negativicoccus succinicivorans]